MKTRVRCEICPKGCQLLSGEIGDCRVRKNSNDRIHSISYSHPSAIRIDPIEKKPMYHVLPGSEILSVGTPGCNLHCKQCQNWHLSQEAIVAPKSITPEEIISLAIKNRSKAIAYTYAEPLVSYEYILDCCIAASKYDLMNVLVTAAFINPEPLRNLCTFLDAANVDLKSFSDAFYRDVCGARLQPVLKALKIMKELDVFIELTHLIIPTLNDSTDETEKLCDWVVEHLGPDTPLHFLRFFPQYQLKHLPPTPTETILNARFIAMEAGLNFVYVGNMTDEAGASTYCSECEAPLIHRRGYQVDPIRLEGGKCPYCGIPVPGIWS